MNQYLRSHCCAKTCVFFVVLACLLGTAARPILSQELSRKVNDGAIIADDEIAEFLALMNDSSVDPFHVRVLLDRKRRSLATKNSLIAAKIVMAGKDLGSKRIESANLSDLAAQLVPQKTDELRRGWKDSPEKLAAIQEIPPNISLDVVEQMLSSAMLERQRITWDIAALSAFIRTLGEAPKQPSELQKLEESIVELSVAQAEKALEAAKFESKMADELSKNGAMGQLESAKIKNQLSKLEFELNAAMKKQVMAKAQHLAEQSQALANPKEELAKLLARKESIDNSMEWLREISLVMHQRDSMMLKSKQFDTLAAQEEILLDELLKQEAELRHIDFMIQDVLEANKPALQ